MTCQLRMRAGLLLAGVDPREYGRRYEAQLRAAEDASIQDYIAQSDSLAALHAQVWPAVACATLWPAAGMPSWAACWLVTVGSRLSRGNVACVPDWQGKRAPCIPCAYPLPLSSSVPHYPSQCDSDKVVPTSPYICSELSTCPGSSSPLTPHTPPPPTPRRSGTATTFWCRWRACWGASSPTWATSAARSGRCRSSPAP